MISSTLMANGAAVYIIGPEQAKLDRCFSNKFTSVPSEIHFIELQKHTIMLHRSNQAEGSSSAFKAT